MVYQYAIGEFQEDRVDEGIRGKLRGADMAYEGLAHDVYAEGRESDQDCWCSYDPHFLCLIPYFALEAFSVACILVQ